MPNISLIRTPARDVSVTNVSNWGAVWNPQLFEYQRQDFPVSLISEAPGDPTKIQVIIMPDPAFAADMADAWNGKNVHIKTQQYDFTLPVVDMQISTSGPQQYTTLIFNKPGHSEQEGQAFYIGFGNTEVYRRSFKVRTTITVNGEVFTLRHSSDANGNVRAEVGEVLRRYLKSVDAFDYQTRSFLDNNAFIQYSVSYTYEYRDAQNNYQEGPVVQLGDFYVTNSALQLKSLYGSNMGQFVTFLKEYNPTKLAKFLTAFSRPVFNAGYPFDISFIRSQFLTGKDLFVAFTTLDLNGNIINGVDPAKKAINGAGDLQLINNDDALLISPTQEGSIVRAAINTALPGVVRLNLIDEFSEAVNYLDMYVYYVDNGAEVQITEVKRIEVRRPGYCPDKHFYFKWVNIFGGWDYWHFSQNADRILEITERSYYEVLVSDYAVQDATENVLKTTARKSFALSEAELDAVFIPGLAAINYSPKVYFMDRLNPLTWLTASVDAKTKTLQSTDNSKGDFEMNVKLPTMNTQFN